MAKPKVITFTDQSIVGKGKDRLVVTIGQPKVKFRPLVKSGNESSALLNRAQVLYLIEELQKWVDATKPFTPLWQ